VLNDIDSVSIDGDSEEMVYEATPLWLAKDPGNSGSVEVVRAIAFEMPRTYPPAFDSVMHVSSDYGDDLSPARFGVRHCDLEIRISMVSLGATKVPSPDIVSTGAEPGRPVVSEEQETRRLASIDELTESVC
jgi:hypothetical protein